MKKNRHREPLDREKRPRAPYNEEGFITCDRCSFLIQLGPVCVWCTRHSNTSRPLNNTKI